MTVRECEQLFSMAVQQKLKRKIVAKIFVTVRWNDELLVIIEREDELKFRLSIGNFSEKLINGLTSDYMAYEIFKQYREFLIERMENKYFYQD